MGRRPNRRHLATYVAGQLSDIERKSIEPIADAAGKAPRTLQEFLSLLRWDEAAVRDRVQRLVAQRYVHPHSVGVIDETSFYKKGNKTACVHRQYCGSRGKLDNCVVTVHLGYAAGDFHTLLDGDLFLPEETWHQDRRRCRAAGIPDDVVYRPKWEIALEQVQRALCNGVRFAWLTFDEGYGGKPAFLRGLEALGQNYVAEIPANATAWTRPPEVMYDERTRERRMGRPRKFPRVKVRNAPACAVRNILTHSSRLRAYPWGRYRVKDGSKGPMVWEAKDLPVWVKDPDGLPTGPYRLLVTRNVLKPEDEKFFLSNAPASVPIETLLLVAFSRWRIERMFQDSKDELGMDHFEVRRYLSIQRHLILTSVSHLFLAEFREQRRGEKSGADDLPGAHRDEGSGRLVVPWRTMLAEEGGIDRSAIALNAGAQRSGSPLASEANHTAITQCRSASTGASRMQMDPNVAL